MQFLMKVHVLMGGLGFFAKIQIQHKVRKIQKIHKIQEIHEIHKYIQNIENTVE